MKKSIIFGSIILLLWSCEELEQPVSNVFVVEGFITADEQVADIKIKETVSLDTEEFEDIPISDAEVTITSGESSVLLSYNNATGKYFDPGNTFSIRNQEEYQIEIVVDGITATSSTVVPDQPTGLELSRDVLIVPQLFLDFTLRTAIQRLFAEEISELTWDSEPGQFYYVVIENKEEVIDPILPSGIPEESVELISSFRFISAPSEATSFNIVAVALETYGLHVAKVYTVNQEYVDLFNSATQDSRDLNEPPSNVISALGIFTSFAVDSVEFEVRRE